MCLAAEVIFENGHFVAREWNTHSSCLYNRPSARPRIIKAADVPFIDARRLQESAPELMAMVSKATEALTSGRAIGVPVDIHTAIREGWLVVTEAVGVLAAR